MKISRQRLLNFSAQTKAASLILFIILGLPASSYGDVVLVHSKNTNSLPTIGEPADQILSPAQERMIGASALRSLYREGRILEDPEVSHYIQHLGNQLTNALGNNEHKYRFFIVNESGINAFAVPGGYIGINSGLILKSKSENELAGVMAHEIAHISQRHIARRLVDMRDNATPTFAAIITGMLLAAGGNSQAGQALLMAGIAASAQQQLNFTRTHEIEADRIGLDILYQAGFDPNGMAEFFKTLQRQRLGSTNSQLEFLRTHPIDNTRITESTIRIDRLPVQKRPDSLSYHMAKARLKALTSDDTQSLVYAIESSNKSKKRKTSIMERYEYSQALELNGENIKAATILKTVIRYDKENINLQIALARANINSGYNSRSLAALEKMVNIYPDNYPLMLYYAETLKYLDRPTEGKDLLKNYLHKHDAPTMEVYKLLAELYANSGEVIHSKQTLAEYYFRIGNLNAAISQLKSALRHKDIDFITRTQIEQTLRIILTASRRARAS